MTQLIVHQYSSCSVKDSNILGHFIVSQMGLIINKGINLRASRIVIGTEPTNRNRPKGRGIKPVSR